MGDLSQVAKDFQSGIVGILGFIGVIITLLWNGHLANLARSRQLDQTRLAVQTALRQELESIRQELENLDKAFQDRVTVSFTLEEPYVYRTLVKDIGVLPPVQAQTIIRVHRDLYLLLNLIKENAVESGKPIANIDPENSPEVAALISDALDVTQIGLSAFATYVVVGKPRRRQTGRDASGTYSVPGREV